MKRVTPSSNASATRWSMEISVVSAEQQLGGERLGGRRSEVVDVDDVVDVVVLQHHGLAPDERRGPGEVDRVERRPVVGVDGLVPEVHGVPVEPDVDQVAAALDDLDVGDVVARARLGDRRRAGGLGGNPEEAVLQPSLVWGVYEGDVPLRSEKHTSELQSRQNPLCRLLL